MSEAYEAIRVEVAKLDAKAGDILVLKLRASVPDQQLRGIADYTGAMFPFNRTMVLPVDCDLLLLTKEQIDARSSPEVD